MLHGDSFGCFGEDWAAKKDDRTPFDSYQKAKNACKYGITWLSRRRNVQILSYLHSQI